MAPSAQDQPAEQVAQALVNFSLYGSFPEEDVSTLNVGPDELPAAIRALSEAKSKLEVCPKAFNDNYHLYLASY